MMYIRIYEQGCILQGDCLTSPANVHISIGRSTQDII
jgi:hypothetical protein